MFRVELCLESDSKFRSPAKRSRRLKPAASASLPAYSFTYLKPVLYVLEGLFDGLFEDKSSTRSTDTEDEDIYVYLLALEDYGSLVFCSRCALQSSVRGTKYECTFGPNGPAA